MNTDDSPALSLRVAAFGQLMDAYEQNYILLRRLFGDLRRLRTGDECPWNAAVMPKVIASSRYTLDIQFTDHSIFGHKQRPLQLKVRIYHDARTAELLESTRRDQCLQAEVSLCTEKQFRRNTLLQKWLIQQLDNLLNTQN
ncbi:MAG: DUF1249 domain-containing protein [Halothiobacillus sp.]